MKIKLDNGDYTIELDEVTVNNIVLEWYTNGMFEYILQDEDGCDLEELLEERYTDGFITESNPMEVLTIK